VTVRRSAATWLGAVLAVAVLAVALLGTAPASASRLTLSGPTRPSHASQARCGSAAVTVTPDGTSGPGGTFTKVRVSGVPAGCVRGTVRVASRTGQAWTEVVAAQPPATVSAGAFTVTVPAFHAPGDGAGRAWVMLDGWPVAATWTRPASSPTTGCVVRAASGATTTKPCTVVWRDETYLWGTAPQRYANLYFDIVAPAADYNAGDTVRVTLDLSTAPGMPAGWRWSTTGTGSGNLVRVPGSSCATLPVLVADAAPWNFTKVYLPIQETMAVGASALCS